jgi:hypothetical protein
VPTCDRDRWAGKGVQKANPLCFPHLHRPMHRKLSRWGVSRLGVVPPPLATLPKSCLCLSLPPAACRSPSATLRGHSTRLRIPSPAQLFENLRGRRMSGFNFRRFNHCRGATSAAAGEEAKRMRTRLRRAARRVRESHSEVCVSWGI